MEPHRERLAQFLQFSQLIDQARRDSDAIVEESAVTEKFYAFIQDEVPKQAMNSLNGWLV